MVDVLQSSYYGKWCLECDTLCHLYEQGLTCGCGSPWENEVMNEDEYPDKWVDVTVTIMRECNER